ncbi:MAG: hypothetical protein GXO26_09020 [Crenarchaeota archaeon]|nr:hypothetical protein [Thermoproteota archaeon]
MSRLDKLILNISTLTGASPNRVRRELTALSILCLIPLVTYLLTNSIILLVLGSVVPVLALSRTSVGKYLKIITGASREAVFGGVLFLSFTAAGRSLNLLMKKFSQYFPNMCKILESNIEKTGNPFLDLFLDVYRGFVKPLGTIPSEIRETYINELEKQLESFSKLLTSVITIVAFTAFAPALLNMVQLFLGSVSSTTTIAATGIVALLCFIVSMRSYVHDYSLSEKIRIRNLKIPIILVSLLAGLATWTITHLVLGLENMSLILASVIAMLLLVTGLRESRLLSKVRFSLLFSRLIYEREMKRKPIDKALNDVLRELSLPQNVANILKRTYPFNIILTALQELSESAVGDIFSFFRETIVKIFTFWDRYSSEAVLYSIFVTASCIAAIGITLYLFNQILPMLPQLQSLSAAGYMSIPLFALSSRELMQLISTAVSLSILTNIIAVFLLVRACGGTYRAGQMTLTVSLIWLVVILVLHMVFPSLVTF